jgi:hypothetical protein
MPILILHLYGLRGQLNFGEFLGGAGALGRGKKPHQSMTELLRGLD